MGDTIFDKIVAKELPARIIWEDNDYMAFLTPFPNTPGVAVIIPKTNPGDYLFDLDDKLIAGFNSAAKKVAKLLEKALGVKRVAMVVEGTGVAYVHIKLYPLHGGLGERTDVWSSHQEFYPEYVGYLTTVEGPKMDDQELDRIQQKILEVNK
jgi:diadenosine tetraphosphate (Ap4A) HIT family hydrolase